MIDDLYGLAFPLAVPFWALMILAPTWSLTRRIVSSPLIVAPILLVCLALMLPGFGDFWSNYTSPTLPGLRELFGTERGAAVIWAHLIAFDLFVGRWMYLDSRDHGVHPLLMAPLLFLTILVSPLGLALYLVLRTLLLLAASGDRGGADQALPNSAPSPRPWHSRRTPTRKESP
jgi:hypothetical protein